MTTATEKTPKGADLPSCKTTDDEMVACGWDKLGKKIWRHKATGEFATLSFQGFASVN